VVINAATKPCFGIDGRTIWMVERGEHFGFTLEAGNAFGFGSEIRLMSAVNLLAWRILVSNSVDLHSISQSYALGLPEGNAPRRNIDNLGKRAYKLSIFSATA